jgi:hypothetical protein
MTAYPNRHPSSPMWMPPDELPAPASEPAVLRGGCKWPVAVPPDDGPVYLFCGEPRRDGDCAYCGVHAAKAYAPRPVYQPRVWKDEPPPEA